MGQTTEPFQALLLSGQVLSKKVVKSYTFCLIQHTTNFCDAIVVGLHASTNKFDENWQNTYTCPRSIVLAATNEQKFWQQYHPEELQPLM